MNEVNAGRQPVVFARDGEVFANSRDVAEFFEKNHRDVTRAIDGLLEQEPKLALRNFARGVYLMPETGPQEHRCFDMNRDGFVLLAMGFTGAKALKWKLRYIEAFNAMETELRASALSVEAVLNDPAALRSLLADYSDRVLTLQGKVEELTPKVQALDRIATTEGSFCISDAAKTLQVNPKELFRYLRSHRWIFTRMGLTGDIAYQERLAAGYLEHKTTTVTRTDGSEKTVTQVRVTTKGLTKLAEEMQRQRALV